MPKAVVLLSGGLDSTTVVAIAKQQGYDVYALSFRYGQRHQEEIRVAEKVAKLHGVKKHTIIDIDLRRFGGSSLTSDLEVGKRRTTAEMAQEIPLTYVPARNTIFLSYALAWAEVLDAKDIFIGVNSVDYSGYPDCRPEFIKAFEMMANLATRAGVQNQAQLRIRTPLLELSKAQIITKGLHLGVDYAQTTSCYDPQNNGKPCLQCDACQLRAKGFLGAGINDPLLAV